MRAVVLTTLLMAMAPVLGCATSECEAVCEQANTCGIKERPAKVDCPEYCADVARFQAEAREAGQPDCKAEFDEHIKCWMTNSKQICNTEFADCNESGEKWYTCMETYCKYVASQENGFDPNCLDETPTLPSFAF